MSEYTGEPEHHNRWLYWGAWALLAVFVVVGLFTFSSAQESKRANEKADQLIAAFEKAGAQRVPSKDQIVRVLGDDGGAVCDDPGNALRQATLYSMMSNGATGPGMRPVIADTRVVVGQLAVIEVYCPDELEDFKSYVSDLKYDDTVKQ
jgi:Tfp pilus assembly protein FimT